MRIVAVATSIVLAWFGALVAGGAWYADRQAESIVGRVSEALHADGTYEVAELGLVRGHFALAGVRAVRDDATGRVELRVGGIDCDLAPLGGALIDRDCRVLAVRGLRLELSSPRALELPRPRRRPFRVESLELEDLALVVTEPAVQVAIQRAVADATVFRSPLSWLRSAREVRATLAGLGPLGTIEIAFDGTRWTARGPELGPQPVALQVTLPPIGEELDGPGEVRALAEVGKSVMTQLATARLLRTLSGT